MTDQAPKCTKIKNTIQQTSVISVENSGLNLVTYEQGLIKCVKNEKWDA